ncbi:MAG TPA: hypothetical protein VM029_01700 [Opitutaceae bacterium]|nr:hypothetical protein [Opitutaceae bacterium]
MTDPTASSVPRRARQKAGLLALGLVLIATGVVVAFLLRRIPLPLRLLIGFGDVVAGCVLLVLVRQKFGR